MFTPSYFATAVCILLLVDTSSGKCHDNQLELNGCEKWWDTASSPLNRDHVRLECLRIMKKYCGELLTVEVSESSGHRPHTHPQAQVTATFTHSGASYDNVFVADKEQISDAGFSLT